MRRLIHALQRLPREVLIGLVKSYRALLSPWVGQSCRFTPTCSRYAIEALERHGAVAGGAYTAWRLVRCNPWCDGGCDPVPDNAPWHRRSRAGAPPADGLFTALLPESGADPGRAATPPVHKTHKTPS